MPWSADNLLNLSRVLVSSLLDDAQIDGAKLPVRMRVLDLPFTAVEWIVPKGTQSDCVEAKGSAPWQVTS